ncbi:MAG: rRNA maturation RNase YbeY [Lachnospiraceae bacterium]|nr:rRNA maturation RNase YbeY [Lachnospiraceae bacterium]MCI9149933.1 rRNA maturation RNase YbeY [Lachnospiraceae bacterium]
MTIAVENNSRQTLDFPYEELAGQVITAALDFEAFPYEAEVSLLLTDLEEIHEINRTQRGIDKPTDVLSFPMIEYPAPGDFSRLEEAVGCFHPDTGEAVLGDIVLCVDKVKEQALEYGHSVIREYAFLILHSMLHLLGYDHMTKEEALVMETKQEQILKVLKISR